MLKHVLSFWGLIFINQIHMCFCLWTPKDAQQSAAPSFFSLNDYCIYSSFISPPRKNTQNASDLGCFTRAAGCEVPRRFFFGRPRAHRGTCASGPFPVEGSKAKAPWKGGGVEKRQRSGSIGVGTFTDPWI